MESLKIVLNLKENGFKDEPYTTTEYEGPIIIGGMPRGTHSGNPTVMIGIRNSDTPNELLVIETTLALFLTVADALKLRYGDPRDTL